jgi:hypothetical protein
MKMEMSVTSGSGGVNSAVAILLYAMWIFYIVRWYGIGREFGVDPLGNIAHAAMSFFMAQMLSSAKYQLFSDNLVGTLFVIFAVIFTVRLATKKYVVWWYDALHLAMSIGMAYMMYDRVWLPFTILTVAFFGFFSVFYVREFWNSRSIKAANGKFSSSKFMSLCSDGCHVAMGVVMAILLVKLSGVAHASSGVPGMHMGMSVLFKH